MLKLYSKLGGGVSFGPRSFQIAHRFSRLEARRALNSRNPYIQIYMFALLGLYLGPLVLMGIHEKGEKAIQIK